MIREPPEAPTTRRTAPSGPTATTGDMEDMGRLPGLMKLLTDGGRPKELDSPGLEKSSISLLKTMPVRFPITFEPRLQVNERREGVAENERAQVRQNYYFVVCKWSFFIKMEKKTLPRRNLNLNLRSVVEWTGVQAI